MNQYLLVPYVALANSSRDKGLKLAGLAGAFSFSLVVAGDELFILVVSMVYQCCQLCHLLSLSHSKAYLGSCGRDGHCDGSERMCVRKQKSGRVIEC